MSVSVGGEHLRGPWTATCDPSCGHDEVAEPNEPWLFRGGWSTAGVDMAPRRHTASQRDPAASLPVFTQYAMRDECGEETSGETPFARQPDRPCRHRRPPVGDRP